MHLENFELIEERVSSLIREVENLREENAQLQARISTLQKKLKENKRRLEHALVSEDEIRRLRSQQQQVHKKISNMLSQLKDI